MLQFITHKSDRFGYVEGAMEALKGGCKWIQLRMKGAEAADIIANGKILRELCNQYEAKLIIDDHVELVETIGADGVHLGKDDMAIDQARLLLGDGYIIGATANCFEDIRDHVSKGADYIGLGPFRFTLTKEKLSGVLGMEGYAKIKQECNEAGYNVPIVAIGGIVYEDIEPIMEIGIGGIALSGTILNAESPQREMDRVVKIMDKYRDE